MALDEKSRDHKVITIYPERNTNASSKFHGNLSNSYGGSFTQQIYYSKCQPHDGVIGKVRESPKALEHIVWEPQIAVKKFVPIHLADAQTFPWICENFDLLVVL